MKSANLGSLRAGVEHITHECCRGCCARCVDNVGYDRREGGGDRVGDD
jgi:hypothetical protein